MKLDTLQAYFSCPPVILLQSQQMNAIYLTICQKMEKILEDDILSDISNKYHRTIENLLELDPEYPEGAWELGGQQSIFGFQSLIQETLIRENEYTKLSDNVSKLKELIKDKINKHIDERAECSDKFLAGIDKESNRLKEEEAKGDILNVAMTSIKNWHPSAMKHMTKYLPLAKRDGTEIDTVMTILSKEVEDQFRKMLESRTGSDYGRLAGDALVGEATRLNIIKSQTIEWYDFMRYFKEPRNTFHHRFPKYPEDEILEFLALSNRLLFIIDGLREERVVKAEYKFSPTPTQDKLHVEVESQEIPSDARVELHLETNRTKKDYSMTHEGSGLWKCDLFAYDLKNIVYNGGVTASVDGVDRSGHFLASGMILPSKVLLNGLNLFECTSSSEKKKDSK